MALTKVSRGLLSTGIVDNSNATAITIDSNERVGIGIESPAEMLEIFNASSPAIQLNDGGDYKSIMRLAGNDLEIRGSSGSLEFYNGSADGDSSTLRMSINAAGTVTASPSGGAVTLGASGHITSKQNLDVATAGGRFVGSSNRGILGQIRVEQIATNANGGYLDFDTCANGSVSPTRRMRLIDTKLLLGKTSQDLNTSGISINGDGYIQVTESASPSLYLNRLTSEGSIINFYKSGTLVGSIGTGSNLLTIGTGTGRLLFENALVAPCSTSSLGASDGVVSLGASDRRFKDLYLSSGVFLGGTGAANKISDVEVGSWTPAVLGCSINAVRAFYVKIGTSVTAHFNIQVTATDSSANPFAISGRPFTASVANSESTGALMLNNYTQLANTVQICCYTYSRDQTIYFYQTISGSTWTQLRRNQVSTSTGIIGSITYEVD